MQVDFLECSMMYFIKPYLPCALRQAIAMFLVLAVNPVCAADVTMSAQQQLNWV